MILDRDLANTDEEDLEIDSNDESQEIQPKALWFMISSEWLFQWKAFISNKLSSQAPKSIFIKNSVNKEIGVLPPGPINNDGLFLDEFPTEGSQVKKGLELNENYRGVNLEVW